ncbi:MAG TPA: efflux RND transporter periplasmic adaptor subunit, partial [Planctomycetota bacterium]|nr:efflux RND transporter periplasmic adaptor subunit [Planctomycetota bacterium]
GLAYERVERRSLARTLERNAELVFDANRHARLSSRAPGVLREIRKNVGDRMEQDETIAVIDSPVLTEAKATYFRSQALLSLRERTLERERKLLDAGAGTERALFEAETGVAEASIVLRDAEERLRSLGLATSEIARLASEKDTSGELHLKTPFAGTIVERSASIGESVDPGDPIISIADVSTLWAKIELREEDVGIVKQGLRATLEVSGLSRRRFEGELLWIGSRVDRRTRTLEACAEIPNPDGLLRDGMFARAVIVLGEDGDGSIAVPKAAVQWDGCCNIVFLKRSESVFEPRRVSLGWETDEFFAVKGGVAEGDVVVTTGSFLLKTEILKESIGAGCCEPRAGG